MYNYTYFSLCTNDFFIVHIFHRALSAYRPDPPPRRADGDRPGDRGGGLLAMLDESEVEAEPLPPAPPPPDVEVPPEVAPNGPEADY